MYYGEKSINDAPLFCGISNAVEVFLYANSSQSAPMQANDREAESLRSVHLAFLRPSVIQKYQFPHDFDQMLGKDGGTLQNIQKDKYLVQATKDRKTQSNGSVEN